MQSPDSILRPPTEDGGCHAEYSTEGRSGASFPAGIRELALSQIVVRATLMRLS